MPQFARIPDLPDREQLMRDFAAQDEKLLSAKELFDAVNDEVYALEKAAEDLNGENCVEEIDNMLQEVYCGSLLKQVRDLKNQDSEMKKCETDKSEKE
eukprot:6278621-Karenia_brevis.AAC.1